MGGHGKKSGKGGGGGGHTGNRNRNPEDRQQLNKDPGVPGADLRRAGERLASRVKQRSLHSGGQGLFGNAGGMARLVAQRQQHTAQRQEEQRSGCRASVEGAGRGDDDDDESMTEADLEERRQRHEADAELQRRRKISEMAALALNAARKQVAHSELEEFVDDSSAGAAGGEYENTTRTHGGARTKDVSMRRFFKSFQKTLDSSDILLEVLDARDPLGCQLRKIEQSIESACGDSKQIVIVLNKADLVPDAVLQQWVDYFRVDQQREFVVPFTAAKTRASGGSGVTFDREGPGGNNGDDAEDDDDGEQQQSVDTGSTMVGPAGRQAGIAKLFSVLRKIARGDGGGRKHVTVGVIGYPNVGKSSVINALKRKDVVGVGNTPGFTTGNTEVDLRSDIKILDCPGVVMPGEDTGDVVLRNAVKVDSLADPLVAVERLCERCDLQHLALVYGLDEQTAASLRNVSDFVKAVGARRGRVRQGGVVDEDETARIILHDWNDGRIAYFTLPPSGSSVLPTHITMIGKPGGAGATAADDADDAGGARIVTSLASGIGLDGLPTFHLRMCEVTGPRKQRGTDDGHGLPASRRRK